MARKLPATPWRLLMLFAMVSVVRAVGVERTDMQTWAGLLAQSFLSHSHDKAHAHTQLKLFHQLVEMKLGLAAAGKDFTTTKGVSEHVDSNVTNIPGYTNLLGGAIKVIDPALYADYSSKIVNTFTGVGLSATFLDYSPCLIIARPYGIGALATGISIQPTGIFVVPTGFNVVVQGLNIAPTIIYVGPIGQNIAPQGFNVAPALIAVAPVYDLKDATPAKDLSGVPFIKAVALPRDGPGTGPVTISYPNGTTEVDYSDVVEG